MRVPKHNHPSRTHDPFLFFLFYFPCISHLSSICNFFVTILVRIFFPYFPPCSIPIFIFPECRNTLKILTNFFLYPSCVEVFFYLLFPSLLLFPLFFLIGVSGYTCHYPCFILIACHAMLCFLFPFIFIACRAMLCFFILFYSYSMPCHVNILLPCPVCVSGYRIIWHAMIL